MKRTAFAAASAALLLYSSFIPPSANAGSETGSAAPAFTLSDVSGTTHSLSQYAGKTVLLEWTNYDCPFVRKHYDSGNMQSLQKAYTAKGVVWLTVNSSAPGKQGHYSPGDWTRLMSEKGSSPTAMLLDPDGKVGRSYGAKTTPHIFVIDPAGQLVYQGAIDDRPGTDTAEIPGARNYAKQALDEVLDGKPVSVTNSKPYGCSVKY